MCDNEQRMALITTTAEAKDCLGRLDDEPEQMQFIEDLKKRFPEFSEQLITDVTAKFDGNAERIIEELNKKSNQLHNEEPQRYLPPIPLDQFSGQEYLDPSMNMSHSRQQSYNMQQGQYHQTLPTPTSRDLETQTLERSYYAGGHGQDYDRYNFNDDVKNPVEGFMQQRSVSSDRLAHGRPEIPEIRKGRSASDVTHLAEVIRKSQQRKEEMSFPPIGARPMPTFISPPHRPVSGIDGVDSVGEIELNRLLQHMQLQQESYARMQIKVNALRKDVCRIREEVRQEEEDMNTRSKVQKNPTEKDVLKLKREIEVLQNEVLDANNCLEQLRDGMDSETGSPTLGAAPPRITREELMSAVRPQQQTTQVRPYMPQSSMNDSLNTFPQMSAPRFPQPQHLNQIPSTSTSQSHPTDQYIRPSSTSQQQQQQIESHQIEDLDNGSSIDNDKWSCGRCTYANHPDLRECEVCGNPKGN